MYLGLGGLLIEGKAGINLCRNTARNNGQDFFSEFNELKDENFSKLFCAVALSLTSLSVAAAVCSSIVFPFFFP